MSPGIPVLLTHSSEDVCDRSHNLGKYLCPSKLCGCGRLNPTIELIHAVPYRYLFLQNVESFGTGKFYKDPEDGGPPLIFQPEVDPLPTASVFAEGEAGVPDKYRRLAAAIFGETEEKMEELILELREAVKEEGLVLPGGQEMQGGPYGQID